MKGRVAVLVVAMLISSVPIAGARRAGNEGAGLLSCIGLESPIGRFFDTVERILSKLPVVGRLFERTMEPIEYADPMIGTDAHGHTFPGAVLPFGMVQLSPDTGTEGWDWCSGYHYSDSSIMGFSHTHLSGTGCADYGDILVMPTTGELKTLPGTKDGPEEGYRSRFSHSSEEVSPGYYSVVLEDYDIKAELTATKRTGIHRYTFPESDEAHVIVDLSHGIGDRTTDAYIKVVGNDAIEGYRRSSGWNDHKVYFSAQFSKPFASYGTWNESEVKKDRKKKRKGIGCFVDFNTRDKESIVIRVGLSSTGMDGARKNLEEEAKSWDFDGYREAASEQWNEELGKIEVEGGRDDMVKFYTALYHTMIAPNVFSDVDGSYMGIDWKVHRTEGTQYTLFSLWDTFRALNPLLTIIEPEVEQDVIRSMLNIYEESGEAGLPRWFLANTDNNCMIGTHSVAVIADAYTKGLRDFDAALAYTAAKTDAEKPGDAGLAKEGKPWRRLGLEDYASLGYVPSGTVGQEVSRTMEYAYDDWCLAQMAKMLGREEDYEHYMDRALNYRNLFNPETGFFQGKNADGSWQRQIAIEKFDTLLREDRNIRDGSNRNTYSIDLSHLIEDSPDRTIYVCFSDSIREDGWGPSVWHFVLEGDGKALADFDVDGSAEEKEYLYKDSNTAIDNDHRFADVNSYWIYRFTIPKGAKTLVARVDMSNQFHVSASSSPEPEPFDPTVQYGYYTEGNAWQWSFFAPQDIDGLIELMGGRDAFVERLDSMFEQEPIVQGSPDISGLIGQYAHGNEPSHHITYLYDYAGMPWKTQERVRQVMDELYGTGADGLCGNEDCGQMSAWYVFSAMGFYPVRPGEARYAIGSPIFDKVTIHLDSGKALVIEARSVENRYIQSATLNGEVLDDPWLEHSALKNGGTLVFEMGSAPNKEWAC